MMKQKPLTEQEWVYRYVKNKDKPLPLIMGTKGGWGMNGEPWIILVALSFNDIMVLCDLHHVPLFHIRKMKIHDLTYYAASITDRSRVTEIMESWQTPPPATDTTSASPQSQGSS
ncbi:hypothetical protein [Ammoniphilus sp. YIM 78166]|uniref:hypothetical protein n=1 Tax=Ammoniphilus sp. YIM 78166 TaxID=1644106 RepID=UPI00106F4DEA|nr:hypothetical protein [Ammoniphilus sp. YIM 78166]